MENQRFSMFSQCSCTQADGFNIPCPVFCHAQGCQKPCFPNGFHRILGNRKISGCCIFSEIAKHYITNGFCNISVVGISTVSKNPSVLIVFHTVLL